MYYITISTFNRKTELGRTVAVADARETVEMLKERLLAAYKAQGARVTDYRKDFFEATSGRKIWRVCIGMVINENDFNGAIRL